MAGIIGPVGATFAPSTTRYNFTQPVVEWIRDWEGAGGLWKIAAYAASFFMLIGCVMTVVGAPLFIIGAFEYSRQETLASLESELAEARELRAEIPELRTRISQLEQPQARQPNRENVRALLAAVQPDISSPLRRRTEQVAILGERLEDAERERDTLCRELAIVKLEPQVFATQTLFKEVGDLREFLIELSGPLTTISQTAKTLKTIYSSGDLANQLALIQELANQALAQIEEEMHTHSS